MEQLKPQGSETSTSEQEKAFQEITDSEFGNDELSVGWGGNSTDMTTNPDVEAEEIRPDH